MTQKRLDQITKEIQEIKKELLDIGEMRPGPSFGALRKFPKEGYEIHYLFT